MMWNRAGVAALVVFAGLSVACDVAQSPVAPTADSPSFTADGGSTKAAGVPVGTFQTGPAASEDVITVSLGEAVTVSGARFVDPDPGDELKVEVEWGDGERSAGGCGPCRVSHVYRRAGTYELTATIHDRRLADRGSVTQAFRVVVSGPPEPIVPIPTLTAGGCYDSTASDFDFRFVGTINQWNNAVVHSSTNGSCTGFNSNAMIVYFEGTQAAALAFCQSIQPSVTYVENTLTRGYPVSSGYFWGCQ